MLTPSKPIKVLVVGAGFGGLAAAIECHRQGHHVEMYESFPEHKVLGDMITLGANASRIVFRWDQGQLMKQLLGLSLNIREYGFRIHKWDSGEVVHVQRHGPPKGKEGMVMAMPPSTGGVPPPMPPNGMGGPPPGMCMPPKLPHIGGHRGELHAAIYTYARDKLQIPIHLGNNITEYEEGDDECALVTSTGQKVSLLFRQYSWRITLTCI
jgi:2-polyprenyl-6-methoxyphenol hydroxylase-like FAD-dependent oxidoreductase